MKMLISTFGASRLWQRIATLYRRPFRLSFDATGAAHSAIVRLGSTQPRLGPLYGSRWPSNVAVTALNRTGTKGSSLLAVVVPITQSQINIILIAGVMVALWGLRRAIQVG